LVNDVYRNVIKRIIYSGKIVGNTKELLNVKLEIDPYDNIATIRDPSIKYMLAELIWYFSGSQSSKWISQFAKLWSKISDDGETSNSAYGYSILYKHGFNQIDQVIEILKNDSNSRRAVININIPHNNKMLTRDEPCTLVLQFYIRDNLLYMTTMMRSNDVWFGLPYDIVFFTEVQKYIARKLGITAGVYTHFVVSLHMYLRDEEKLEKVLSTVESKNISINFQKLIENAETLYNIVNKDNIIDICKDWRILE